MGEIRSDEDGVSSVCVHQASVDFLEEVGHKDENIMLIIFNMM